MEPFMEPSDRKRGPEKAVSPDPLGFDVAIGPSPGNSTDRL
jgi:hypothetical protein